MLSLEELARSGIDALLLDDAATSIVRQSGGGRDALLSIMVMLA